MNKAEVDRLYEQLIQRFVEWAEDRPDIRAAIVLGSRARTHNPADEWSDLDVIVVATEVERYVRSADWIRNIGTPLLTFVEPTPDGGMMERRVLFEGMLDVDFTIVPESKVKELLQAGKDQQTAFQISDLFGRGVRVLFDKNGTMDKVQALAQSVDRPRPSLPSEQEFLQLVSDFLYHSVFTAKHLLRGELWWAKMCLDCYMQRLLLQIVEWHARASHGPDYDTWFRGRFLEKWADPRIVKGLSVAFAHYNEADVKRALVEAMNLFRLTATETATRLRHHYPVDADRQITDWIEKCFSGKEKRVL